MESRDLRYFLTVAEELHFGKAAERLHMSQPPLSQAIRRLEEDLGTQLFERSSRNVALTKAGEYLLGEAREILGRTATAEATLRRMGRGESGSLRIGLVGPALEGGMACTIRNYRAQNPDVTIDLRQMASGKQLDRIRGGRLDVGIVRLFGHSTRGLDTILYSSEPYMLAVPEGHRFAAQDTVHLAELDGEQLLTFTRDAHPHLYDELIACYRKAGACPALITVSIFKHTMSALVATGMGLALMPAGMARAPRPGVVFKPVRGELPAVEFSLTWKQGNYTPLVRRFTESVMDAREACGVPEPHEKAPA